MILKIAGSVIVIAASSLAGLYYGSLETYRIGDLSEMKKALAILKSEIEFSLNPLPQAFLNISLRTKKPVSNIFMYACENLKTNPELGISVIWEKCVELCRKEAYFNKEDSTQLISFGNTLGYLDAGMQTASIGIIIEYINERINELNSSREKNKKMFGSLGILGGLLTVVVFI